MNISCLKENLKEHLDNALRIVKYNSTLPILNNFLLNTEKGVLKISSTDLEIGFTSWVPSKILKEGSITVPAQLLSQFINNLPNKTVEMEVKDNNKLYLSCDNIKAHINGLSADDFPIIPRIKNDSIMTVDSLILKEAIGSVINSAASSDTTCLLVKIKPSALTINPVPPPTRCDSPDSGFNCGPNGLKGSISPSVNSLLTIILTTDGETLATAEMVADSSSTETTVLFSIIALS